MIHFIYKNKLKSINCLNVSDTKKDDIASSVMETEDLGYAVVVEDENRQTKLIN
jgi:hypothetical protein